MARASFGGGVADFVVTAAAPGDPLRFAPATLTMWDAETGGTQHTDLLLDGDPVTSIRVGADGQVPTFQGPDGVVMMWAQAGTSGSRAMVDAAGYIATLAQAAASLAQEAQEAAEAAAAAAAAVGATNDTIIAGRLADSASASVAALDHAAADLLDIPTSALAIKSSASYADKLDNAATSSNGALTVSKLTKVDATSGARAMTIPDGTIKGQQLAVEKVDSSTNTVTITGKIRSTGSSTFTLSYQYETIQFIWGGTYWEPLAGHRTKSSLDGAYNLKNAESLALHGPDGSGLTDTVSAFAAAVAAAPSGGVVVVPPAATEYLWDSTLTISKPLTIIAPQGATVRLGSNERLSIQSNDVKIEGITFIKAAAQPWLNLLRPRTTPVVQATGVEFRRCKFDGVALRFWKIGTLNPDGTTQASGTGTDIKTAKVLDCEFTNYAESYTVYLAGTTDCLVERCWFHDYGLDSNKGEGVKVQGGSVGTRILNNVFENSTRDAIDVYDSSYNTIIGNTFRNMAAVGVDMKWDSTANTNDPRRNIVMGNRAISCGSGGFHCDAPESVIEGNEAISCGYGFKVGTDNGSVQPTKRVSLVNNKAISSTNDGFSIGAGDSLVLIGNQSYGNGAYGFATVSTAVNSVMIGNTAFGNTSGGIQGDAATKGFTLMGNATQDTATNGVTAIQNNIPLSGRKADGSLVDMLKMNTSDDLLIGDANRNIRPMGKVSLDKALIRKRSTQALAANGTVTVDVLAAQIHEITLNANATSFTISNAATGMEFDLHLIQDAAGGRTYTFPAGFKFAGGAAPSDTTANTRTTIRFICGGTSTFREIGRSVAVTT